MQLRNIIALALVLISFIVLYPGLTQPMITIKVSFSILGTTQELYKQTRSIIGTVRSLHESGNDFVAGLILLFSVLVPFVKGALLGLAVVLRGTARQKIVSVVRAISKWAMADVFVVGVYIALLASNATDNLDAVLHAGFYYFTAYCLISLLALQFMHADVSPEAVSGKRPLA